MATETLDDLIVRIGHCEIERSLRMLAAVDLARGFERLALAEIVLSEAQSYASTPEPGSESDG